MTNETGGAVTVIEQHRRQLFYLVNGTLLICNIALLVALIMTSFSLSNPTTARARNEAGLTDMTVYCAKGPFAILVDNNFPQTHKFVFVDYSQQLTLQGYPIESSRDYKATRTAMLVVGPDVALSCDYWIADAHGKSRAEAEIDSIMLQTKEKGVYDLNVDGIFDKRIVTDSDLGTGSEQIWYDCKWQDVLPHGRAPRYERQLPEIGLVTFEKKTGQWTRAANQKQAEVK